MAQQYTRGPSCKNVANNPAGHKSWCRSPHFVSKFVGNYSVFELKDILQIEFRDVDGTFFVIDVDKLIEIGDKPLCLSGIDGIITKNSNTLNIATAHRDKKLLAIVGAANKPIRWKSAKIVSW